MCSKEDGRLLLMIHILRGRRVQEADQSVNPEQPKNIGDETTPETNINNRKNGSSHNTSILF
jgi:hypothetical protein